MLTLIVTAFRANNTLLENYKANIALAEEAAMLNLDHEADAIGSYKEEGQDKSSQEISQIYTGSSNKLRELAEIACTTYKQDAVLILSDLPSKQPTAYLVTWDGAYLNYQTLGLFKPVSEEEAKASVAYTWINGIYYIAEM